MGKDNAVPININRCDGHAMLCPSYPLIGSIKWRQGVDHRQAKEALLHHLQALKEIPIDIMIPASITLSTQGMQDLMNIVTNPPEPNPALLDLMVN